MPEQDIFEEDQVDVNVDAAEENSVTVNEYRSSITIGDVETLDSGDQAYVTNSGTESDVILNFGLPKGSSGTTWGDIDGTLSNQTDLQTVINQLASRINALEQALPPVGSVISSTVNSMAGWILCAGQEVSRTTYSALFNAIGIGFGAGDGISTFNVPDYRGCFLRGLGGNSAIDIYTKQPTALPNIKGTFAGQRGVASSGALNTISTPNLGSAEHWVTRSWDCSINFNAANYSSVYQDDITEARPTNFAVNFFIKY